MAGEFVKLIDSKQVSAVTLAFERAIADSFVTHPMRHMTRAEVKRRFDECSKIFCELRGQLKWGVQRAIDHIPEYLGKVLNGESWKPDRRACWMPGDDDQITQRISRG